MKTAKIEDGTFDQPGYESKPAPAQMTRLSKLTVMLSGITVCLFLTGCFSYTTNSDERTPAAAVQTPSVTTGFNTTGRTDEDFAQRQRTVIYLDPWILGNT